MFQTVPLDMFYFPLLHLQLWAQVIWPLWCSVQFSHVWKCSYQTFFIDKCGKLVFNLIWPTVKTLFMYIIFFVIVYVQHYHIYSYQESLPQKQTLWIFSVYSVSLRKQCGLHICGFRLNGGYYMNAALSWVQTDEGPGSVWGEITYWFFCATGPHWFNIHRHIEAGNELYQSLDTFLPCLPRHCGSGMIFF